MKKTLTLILFLITLISYSQNKSKNNNQKLLPKVDYSNIAFLANDEVFGDPFKTGKHTELNQTEMVEVEKLLVDCVKKYNVFAEKRFYTAKNNRPKSKINKNNFYINLARYKRQYVVIINNEGQKEIWVNCLCSTKNINWKNEIPLVHDGGNCYFNLKINLSKKIFYDFYVNGEA